MSAGLVPVAVGVLAYAASSVVDIELPGGGRVTPLAAFGAALVVLDPLQEGPIVSITVLAGALAAETCVRLVVRRSVLVVPVHGIALLVGAITVWGLDVGSTLIGLPDTLGPLVGAAIVSLCLVMSDVVMDLRGVGARWRSRLGDAAAVYVILAATAGLLVLVFPHLSWTAFLVMFIPVLAIRHELQRYAETRRTYVQMIQALSSLVENAGYVPRGHHARVSALCGALARELGLPESKVQDLELVALLHDVGAVSLRDPEDVRAEHLVMIAQRSGEVLAETGRLAEYVDVLSGAAGASEEIGLEAQILRLANSVDDLPEGLQGHVGEIESMMGRGYEDVLAAFRRVVSSA